MRHKYAGAVTPADGACLQCGGPVARLPAMLLQHPHIRHDHAAIDRLAHIVNRQQPDLHGSQGFHHVPGLAVGLHGSGHQLGTVSESVENLS
jgi:hypothetical protein